MKDSVSNHLKTDHTEFAKVDLASDRTFSKKNRHLYFNSENPPEKTGEIAFDVFDPEFQIL